VSGERASDAVLSARGISVSFGGVHAVVDVDLDVEPGQLVGLIGPNGAGKTTFIDAVTGFVSHRGTVALAGNDITGAPPHVRARRGLARTWQAIELFDDLSVRENLTVAAHHPSMRATVRELFARPVAGSDAVDDALDMFGLVELAEATPGELTQGQRKLVGVARALAGHPRLLCLDEPAAGLDARESEELGRSLRELADRGQSTLLIDHDMGLVLSICDRVVVLEFGQIIADGTPEAVRADPLVIAAYLGEGVTGGGQASEGAFLDKTSG
jgi:branched-chain amino acid transport system ATP-binding protein